MEQLIYKLYKNNREDWRRPHLGASMIGDKCDRKLYYSFRWVKDPKFDGRILKLFKRGHKEEQFVFNDLRSLASTIKEPSFEMLLDDVDQDSYLYKILKDGFTVKEFDDEQKRQYNFLYKGHLSGSCDAILSTKQKDFLLEIKTSNTSKFKALKKKGLKDANFTYFLQAQIYMHFFKLSQCIHYTVCKENDELYIEVLDYDPELSSIYIERAIGIIKSNILPAKVSESPNFLCRFCGYLDICQNDNVSEVEQNCRTCKYSVPILEGEYRWFCKKLNVEIELEDQKKQLECYTISDLIKQK
jgi:hypothetical protein